MAIRQMTNAHPVGAAPSAVARHVLQLRDIEQRWIPLAGERLAAAESSPADRRRWQHLIAAVDPAKPVVNSFEELLVCAFCVRDLIRALRDSPPGTPPVHEVAHQIRQAIGNGTFAGTLSMKRISVGLRVPATLVQLAVVDLLEAGELCTRRGRPAVPASSHPPSPPVAAITARDGPQEIERSKTQPAFTARRTDAMNRTHGLDIARDTP
jgi:hypothetical protein